MCDKTQKYLGTKTGVVLCIDYADSINFSGRMYHLYEKDAVPIYGCFDFLLKTENLFKKVGYPIAGQSDKNFDNQKLPDIPVKELEMVRHDEDILNEHGEQGTFIVRVQHRQHSSWQGRVTWLDEDKTVYFRSELELIKLIDGALQEKEFEIEDK